MSSAAGWLGRRRPIPPESLRAWLVPSDAEGLTHQFLTARGRSELDRARAGLGPVRASAYHLLAADAFVTYACEAALESSDPSVAFIRVLEEIVEE